MASVFAVDILQQRWGMVVRLKLAPGLGVLRHSKALLSSSGTCAARLPLAAGKMRPRELALGYRLRHGRRSRVTASPTGDTAKMDWHEQVERRQSLPTSNAPSQRQGLQEPPLRSWCVQSPDAHDQLRDVLATTARPAYSPVP